MCARVVAFYGLYVRPALGKHGIDLARQLPDM